MQRTRSLAASLVPLSLSCVMLACGGPLDASDGDGLELLDSAISATPGTSFGVNSANDAITLKRPAEAVAGQLLVAAISVRGKPMLTAPAGWSLVRIDSNKNTMRQAIYTRRAGSTEPSTYTWRFSSKQSAAGGILTFSGVDTVTAVDAQSGSVNGHSKSIQASGVSTSATSTKILGFYGIANASTIAPPPGMTERGEAAYAASGYKVTLEVAEKSLATSGSTGALTATASAAAASIGQLIALNLDGSTPTDPTEPTEDLPEVRITQPTAGATITGTFSYSAEASLENATVSRVDFYIDGVLRFSDSTSPFSGSVDSKQLTNATHAFKVEAVFSTGVKASATTSAQVSNTTDTTPTTDGSCTRFVSTTGSDSAFGSATSPWRTVSASIPKLFPGDTLCLRAGTYAESVKPGSTLRKGTASARITLRSHPGEIAVLKGNHLFRNPDHWTFSDLEITNPGSTAALFIIVGGMGWVFERNDVHTGAYAGLLVGRSSDAFPHDYVVRQNTIHDTTASNFYHNPGRGSTGGLIERNLFFNSGTQNLKLGWGGTDVCTGSNYDNFGIGEVTVRYNTMYNAKQPLAVAESGGEGKVDIYRNLVFKSTSTYLVRIDNVEGCLRDNVWVHDNAGGGASKWAEDFGHQPTVMKQMTNNVFPLDPQFDSTTRTGFHPANSVAKAYGRYAP